MSEFEQLLSRLKQAQEYEKTMYMTDTPEGKAWAEKTFKQILDRLNELWIQISEEQKNKYINQF